MEAKPPYSSESVRKLSSDPRRPNSIPLSGFGERTKES